ncbi:hypothetical protein AVEN_188802-1 [Araneus ventricosus]|uniref:Uncharacterized protein n=1 Tax=Araneus ventricosus TaxID=182803 RepID=A0A4Y2BS53_ARAVE|nr:hypothetical protein AVEN_188802-1 [Araneus ventricosus]
MGRVRTRFSSLYYEAKNKMGHIKPKGRDLNTYSILLVELRSQTQNAPFCVRIKESRGVNTPAGKLRPRWPSGKAPTSGPEGRKFLYDIRLVWGLLHAKSYVVAKRPSVGVAQKFGEGVPAQVSSSSSDRGWNLQGSALIIPRVASKRDFNLT